VGLFGRDDRNTPVKQPVVDPTPRPAPKSAGSQPSSPTLISPGSRIEGTLSGSDDISIQGQLEGTIDVQGTVFIDERGSADARVRGTAVVVAGKIEGDVEATERIELVETAIVHGDITAPKITIREGATFEGQVFMKGPGQPTKSEGSPATKKK